MTDAWLALTSALLGAGAGWFYAWSKPDGLWHLQQREIALDWQVRALRQRLARLDADDDDDPDDGVVSLWD